MTECRSRKRAAEKVQLKFPEGRLFKPALDPDALVIILNKYFRQRLEALPRPFADNLDASQPGHVVLVPNDFANPPIIHRP